jgi:translation initiation factor 2B subunit (eIF-2B alpha/beta/delta family)
MTNWADWPTRRRIAALADGHQSGEAESGALIAAELAVFIERVGSYAPEAFPEAIETVVRAIIARRPASAPLLTLANAVFLTIDRGAETVIAEVRAVAERLRTSVDILATMGAAFVPDGGSVLAHGTSSSVKRLLEEAARDKRFRVTCEAGRDGAGRLFAADLIESGLAVEVVGDGLVVDSLFGVDLLVMGASAFGPDSMINTVGTDVLLKEATNLDVRALLVTSADKALPGPLFERAVAAAIDTDGLEVVRLAQFEAVVTELGVLDPSAASRLAERREVAPQLA